VRLGQGRGTFRSPRALGTESCRSAAAPGAVLCSYSVNDDVSNLPNRETWRASALCRQETLDSHQLDKSGIGRREMC